jgi:hypothetical protein
MIRAGGKQLVVSELLHRSADEGEQAGGERAVFAKMLQTNAELCPGFNDALEDFKTMRHRQLWMVPLSIGPKLTRPSSTPGLWFIGDGSRAIGDLYIEGAASAGILGARSIVEALNRTGVSTVSA